LLENACAMKRPLHLTATIFVVTNSYDLGRIYRRNFERSGLEVAAIFSSGRSLISYFEKRREVKRKGTSPNKLVLLDQETLGSPAEETAKRLRELKPNLKIVLATTRKPSTPITGGALFDAVILKPFTMPEFLEIIRNAFSKLKERGTAVLDSQEDMDALMSDVLFDSNKKLCLCDVSWVPHESESATSYWSSLEVTRSRGMQVLLLTSVTRDNLVACKELISSLGVEIRHLEGLARNFSIFDERHFVSISRFSKDLSAIEELVYSNLDSVRQENQFLFDKWWGLAAPAMERIEELEETISDDQGKIGSIISGPYNISKTRLAIIENAGERLDLVSPPGLLEDFEDDVSLNEALVGAKSRGVRCKILTKISKEDLAACQAMGRIGFEVKHLTSPMGQRLMNEKESLSSTRIEKLEIGANPSTSIYSNHQEFVNQARMTFDALWEAAIPLSTRIYDIERERETNIF
jgi:hypothetical protein